MQIGKHAGEPTSVRTALVVWGAAMLACGGHVDDGASKEGTFSTECRSFAADLCHFVEQCAPTRLAGSFGSIELCRERHARACQVMLDLPDAALEQSDLEPCLFDMTCDRAVWLLSIGAQACPRRPGRRTEGACVSDAQCSGGKCRRSGEGCGECTTSDFTLTHLEDGEPCEMDWQCGYDNALCIDGICVSGSLREGDACDPFAYAQAPFCDRTQGLVCGASSRCESPDISEPGGSCGKAVYELGPAPLCRGPGYCRNQSDIGYGTCVSSVADGEACDFDLMCIFPALCINGACELPDMALCQ